ncbi:hypothetical protein [Jatrophihabitans sp.]|uniref:hypothetical protein n=1 Tax=Jatrophihabitans sp. TaxID=1932789 RepID=UPI0030C7346E|nr:hypothetical protein [Jatrophihabitans sp.]
MAELHEVWVELVSGTRVIVGRDLATHAAASEIAREWRAIAESSSDRLYESMKGSGALIRGSSIIAIKAQLQPKVGVFEGALKVERAGSWL